MSVENWFLEGYFNAGLNAGLLSRLPLKKFPFQVGRQPGIGLTINDHSVSRIHAELTLSNGHLVLRDNQSTNGTFVNRVRLTTPVELRHGDVVHFADIEARVMMELESTGVFKSLSEMTIVAQGPLSNKIPEGVRQLQELLAKQWVVPAFQPIVDARTGAVHAYEVLGRGTHPTLSPSPGHLFHIAESMGTLAVDLSHLFREIGVNTAATFQTDAKFFVNIHPLELNQPQVLLQHLEHLRRAHPKLSLVLEIHEKAASNLHDMHQLGIALDRLGIQLAYDDFGAGQARLMELVEAPADYLKFDIGLVHDIDTAPPAKRDMVQMLVTMAQKMGIATLAEGLETQAEVSTCQAMGFDYIQGYFYGRPVEGALR
jgi:EAL domain-containing protein (putative c-di-GMP-specific phosphodiesterase class I)